jgi:hypothetical protein
MYFSLHILQVQGHYVARPNVAVSNVARPQKEAWSKEVGGPFLTSPLGKILTPRGEVVPQGWICPLGVKLSPGGEIICLPLHSSKQ